MTHACTHARTHARTLMNEWEGDMMRIGMYILDSFISSHIVGRVVFSSLFSLRFGGWKGSSFFLSHTGSKLQYGRRTGEGGKGGHGKHRR